MELDKAKKAVIVGLEVAEKVTEYLATRPYGEVAHFLSEFLVMARATVHDITPAPAPLAVAPTEEVKT